MRLTCTLSWNMSAGQGGQVCGASVRTSARGSTCLRIEIDIRKRSFAGDDACFVYRVLYCMCCTPACVEYSSMNGCAFWRPIQLSSPGWWAAQSKSPNQGHSFLARTERASTLGLGVLATPDVLGGALACARRAEPVPGARSHQEILRQRGVPEHARLRQDDRIAHRAP